MDSDSEGDQLTNLAQAETPGFHLPRTELGTLIAREFDTRLSEHCVAINLLFEKNGLPQITERWPCGDNSNDSIGSAAKVLF